MSELDLSQVEEVPVPQSGLPFPIPVVDTVIKQAAISVLHGENQFGQPAVLLQFITPGMMYTVQLTGEAAENLANELRPSPLVKATLADLPKA